MAGGNIPSNLAPLFVAAGQQYHIPANVLAGVASVETNLGANRSTSSAGAQGLMQFMPGTAASLGVNVGDDRSSIFGAAKLLNQYGYQSNPLRALGAYNGGPGNPQYGYAHQVMSEAQRLAGSLGGGAAPVAPAGQASAPSSAGTPGSPGGVDYNAAGIAALMAAANKPISDKGTFKSDNVLGRLMGNVASGKYTTPATPGTAPSSPPAGQAAAPVGKGGGDVNPLHGWNLGRTDMGVDASANVGAPIRAINDSKVVGVSPNWYAGQPYLLMQLTAGPNAGKYWYVSEQIAGLAPVGSIVRKGDPVAHFAPSGTGIEIGWGSPTPGRTLAAAQGNTGDASHNNAPAGIDFAHLLASLKGT